MTKEEFKKIHTDEELQIVEEFLQDYADMIEEEEPYATNSISRYRNVCSSLPISIDDI